MLEPPDLPEEALRACLCAAYGLDVAGLAFLPLGADVNTAVYRAVGAEGRPYFVKLRRGAFDGLAVELPRWLSDRGSATTIPPLPTADGGLWAQLPPFTVVLSPFVEGYDAHGVALSEDQWRRFGAAVRFLHAAELPQALLRRLPQESYGAGARDFVARTMAQLESATFDDPVATRLAAFLLEHQATVHQLVARAAALAQRLRARGLPHVACHADLHAANLLLTDAGELYLVDWDTLVSAPKERDLMFVGSGLGFHGVSAEEEARLFYQGYGPAQIDPEALAYYRYERIVQDIAAYIEELLLTTAGGADRERSLGFVMSNFAPGGTIDRARAVDPALRRRRG